MIDLTIRDLEISLSLHFHITSRKWNANIPGDFSSGCPLSSLSIKPVDQ